MQRTGLLNWNNITYDKDNTAGLLASLTAWVIDWFGTSWSGATTNIQSWKALIECTRTNWEKVMAYFENTGDVVIDFTGTKKVYIAVDQAKLDDWSNNAEDGTWIASIQTGASYPASNYIPLYNIASWTPTDDRVVVRSKLKRNWQTANRLSYFDANWVEQFLDFWSAWQLLWSNWLTTPPSWQNVQSAIQWEIRIWTTLTAPTWWLICNWSAVSRTTYSWLFSIIWTTYGVWDWSTTFNLPNLQWKVIAWYNSWETEFNTIGKTWGAKTHTLTTTEMPAHTHGLPNAANSWTNDDKKISWTYLRDPVAADTFTNSEWGGQAHNNLQPYIALNYIIKF